LATRSTQSCFRKVVVAAMKNDPSFFTTADRTVAHLQRELGVDRGTAVSVEDTSGHHHRGVDHVDGGDPHQGCESRDGNDPQNQRMSAGWATPVPLPSPPLPGERVSVRGTFARQVQPLTLTLSPLAGRGD
jgi:hypothetical protein